MFSEFVFSFPLGKAFLSLVFHFVHPFSRSHPGILELCGVVFSYYPFTFHSPQFLSCKSVAMSIFCWKYRNILLSAVMWTNLVRVTGFWLQLSAQGSCWVGNPICLEHARDRSDCPIYLAPGTTALFKQHLSSLSWGALDFCSEFLL